MASSFQDGHTIVSSQYKDLAEWDEKLRMVALRRARNETGYFKLPAQEISIELTKIDPEGRFFTTDTESLSFIRS
jgi:hypothetical protein